MRSERERENIRETENMAEGVRQYQRNWNEHVEKVTPERLGRKSQGKTSIWSTKKETEGAFRFTSERHCGPRPATTV